MKREKKKKREGDGVRYDRKEEELRKRGMEVRRM